MANNDRGGRYDRDPFRDDDRARGYGRDDVRRAERDRDWDERARRRGEAEGYGWDERLGGRGYDPYGEPYGRDYPGPLPYGAGAWPLGFGGSGYPGSFGYPGYGYPRYGDRYGYDRPREHYHGDRNVFERAGDEIASWFGSEEAERRRRRDALEGDTGAAHHRGKGPRGYTRSDERIREDVSDRLMDDPHIDASDIEVAVAEGEVTLNGTVDSRFAKRHAEDIVEDLSGIRHVQNNLRVQQPGM